MSRSVALDAFEVARARLDTYVASPARRRVSIDSVTRRDVPWVPEWSSGPMPRPAGSGPLAQALADQASGVVTAVELVQRAAVASESARLSAPDALCAHNWEAALVEAEQLDRERSEGRLRGPLHGVPVTIKDVIDVAGLPTRCGSDAYHDVPARDATSVARWRAAGAVIIGKAVTHEFAMGVTCPQIRNPHDTTRIPGGSSGGSAVALVQGIGVGSLGTDTRASLRTPAALSGCVGLKPTYGRVPTDGVVSLSWTMDHVGPMAMSVGDAALLLDVLLGSADLAAAARSDQVPAGLRVGVPEAAFDSAPPAVVATVRSAIDLLHTLGCRIDDASAPDSEDFSDANSAGLVVSRCDAAAQHASLGLDRSLYWAEVRDQLAGAESVSALEYLQAQRLRAELRDRFSAQFELVDLLAMPTSPVVAPPVDDFESYLMLLSRNAIPWSFVGFPAISVPVGFVDGLPVGLQLVAPPDREPLLVAVAARLEDALAAG